MVISGNNLLFIYRENDIDSEELADYYLDFYGLDDTHKLAVPCSGDEILTDYSTFQSEVENPIKNALSSIPFDIYIIILGYNVPGGFYDELDIVSATSRISRIFHTFSKRTGNYFYDRRVGPHLVEDDFEFAIICSRIDAPSLDLAKKLVGFEQEYRNQYKANGTFFFDPIAGISGSAISTSGVAGTEYKNDLDDFFDNLLFKLNIDVFYTQSNETNIDIVIPHLQHDSFYWGWFNDRSVDTFFASTNTARVFFYNADYDSAFTIRDNSDGNFSPLAITNGYSSNVGAMSNPGFDGFIRPRPFFYALNDGAILGEAYLFSEPFLDWTNCFIGDPLVKVHFPENKEITVEDITSLNENIISWNDANVNMSRIIAYHWNKEINVISALELIVHDEDISTEVSSLYRAYDLYNYTTSSSRAFRFSSLVEGLFNYAYLNIIPKTNQQLQQNLKTINDFLTYNNYKVSRLFLGLSEFLDDIPNSLLFDEGYWEFKDYIYSEIRNYVFYHFELDVATDANFTNIVLSFDSELNQSSWEYEKENNKFVPMAANGVSSSFVGRKIKYISSVVDYLDRGVIYYFRIRQKANGSEYGYRRFNEIVHT